MRPEYWIRQPDGHAAFSDMLWSRPENKMYAGKLLIIGGNAHGFVAPTEAYRFAEKAGAGVIKMLLPDSIRQFVGNSFEAGELAPTTPSGSFSQQALALYLDMAQWADAVLLAGSFGKNSETAILLEKFAATYRGPLAVCGDAADYFVTTPGPVIDRPDTLLALDFGQLQKLAASAHFPQAFTSRLDLVHFVAQLHELAAAHQTNWLASYQGQTFIAAEGQLSSTPIDNNPLELACQATVWWLQHPGKPFQAMTTALAHE
jgi:NAD(P)H-hydrate repair Nnr-like enzyme with NAD(P)H-hydrate dehydratase domain